MALRFLCFAITFSFISMAFAEKVCVKNAKELEAKKESFPKFLQEKKEVSFGHTEIRPIAMRFQVTEDKIIAQYALKVAFVRIPYVGYATDICYDKDTQELVLAMDNKKQVTAKVINDDPPNATVIVREHTLTRSSEVYNKAAKILGGFEDSLQKTLADKATGGAQ